MPLKTKAKGPAPLENNAQNKDIIDEVLEYFKPNVLFRKYQIEGEADRVLIYLTVYVHQCLLRLERKNVQNRTEADKILFQLAQERFSLPGEGDFVLGGYYSPPANSTEKGLIEGYFKQAREEAGLRLLDKVFVDGPNNPPTKFWMQFVSILYFFFSFSSIFIDPSQVLFFFNYTNVFTHIFRFLNKAFEN